MNRGLPEGWEPVEEPLLSWRARAQLTLLAMGATAALAWHAAVAATSGGVDLAEPDATLGALARLAPVSGLGPDAPANPGLTAALWGALLLLELVAYLAAAWQVGSWRARRRRRAARRAAAVVGERAAGERVPPERPVEARSRVRRCARTPAPPRRHGRH
ncbi:hypothetical protein CLV92_102333 [Kineococcus xinjiangensis]|uniref:Uncharacterized protein n=1 Tax=Kineococcus xinjiangensis TaxID=512762 RepID=A0A2S6IV80_9ACTN|nr:hypothetical protein [Kineococcus xinjiangensis]PPK98180.1 hypothetical protein CLV92_102333 [Kineococcus xinjiangensis]